MDLVITEKIGLSVPTLCLNMIVKNESKIITRMFDTVSKLIDCYCICDTGSTDNTVEIIENYFKEKNIPGKVVHEPFKNFAHNRNYAIKSCVGMSDYILLMDADMKLDIKNFDKMALLQADFFTILQGSEAFYYENTRIVKNTGQFEYVGVTHEYINVPGGSLKGTISKNGLFIIDVGDGGAKGDKFERDIRLLEGGLLEEPTNVRYHFYLANTYHDTGRFEQAIELYTKRIALGGWDQEIWYSHYRIGSCYEKMGKIKEAIYSWLEGYNFFPDRIENIYEIVKHYRIIGKHKLSKMFYDIARNVINKNLNKDTYLFLHNDVYTYKLEYELSVIGAYIGMRTINHQVITVLNNCFDESTNENVLTNLKFYKFILNPRMTVRLSDEFDYNVGPVSKKFLSSSSCIIPHTFTYDFDSSVKDITVDGYMMNVRYVNYYILDNGGYTNYDNHIVSLNKCIFMTKDFKIINEKTKLFELDYNGRLYMGTEDIKIFKDPKTQEVKMIGTAFHSNDKIGIVIGDYDLTKPKLDAVEINPGFCRMDCEKNWVYLNYKDDLAVIYRWYPLTICRTEKNDTTGEQLIHKMFENANMPKIFQRVRGSTCGFSYKNEVWFVCHIVSYEAPRHYYHMFVVLDTEMNLLRYSAPFKFGESPIEYCLGLIVEDDRVLVTYSEWDRTTQIAVYDKPYVENILCYKP